MDEHWMNTDEWPVISLQLQLEVSISHLSRCIFFAAHAALQRCVPNMETNSAGGPGLGRLCLRGYLFFKQMFRSQTLQSTPAHNKRTLSCWSPSNSFYLLFKCLHMPPFIDACLSINQSKVQWTPRSKLILLTSSY